LIVYIASRVSGDVAVFDIAGDLTRKDSPVPTLHELARGQLETGIHKILFNFEKVGFVDSFGLGQIVSSYISTQKLGGGFKLCQVPPKLLYFLELVKLVPNVISIYPDEASALESFAHPSPPEDPTNLEP
jgi:anti-anti-sigma factor